MFAKTQNTVSMILGVALSAAATFAAPAFAGEASLSHNERAAQSAIAGETESRTVATYDVSSPSLAQSEALAQRAIVDAPAPATPRNATTGQVSLTQNEIAAQRSIADATASAGETSNGAAATTSVASTGSPVTH
jgi:hypothetical protein